MIIRCNICKCQIDEHQDERYSCGNATLCSPKCVFTWRGRNSAW